MRSLFLLALLLANTSVSTPQTVPSALQDEIQAFNKKLEDATRSMNNVEVLALWADDGISLLPSTKPLVGKAAISAFLYNVTAQLQGAKMEKFEMHCSAIEGSGNWASEWCDEHQVVVLPGGKPPFDGRGKMLFVLRKQADGNWRIEREMWNQAGRD